MIDRGKHNLLGVLVNAMDYEAAVERIVAAARDRRAFSVTALAVHGVMTGATDPIHRYRLNSFDLVLPDGQPVRWALNLLYRVALADRVYGPTLMLRLCERAAAEGLPVFLYGSAEAVVSQLHDSLLLRFPGLKIAGRMPSLFRRAQGSEQERIAGEIERSGARIVFVGLGCPRQEVWAYESRSRLHMPAVAIGAAFDFHAGRLPQAPQYLQRYGLEWLFRLIQEPGRLWRRYLLLNPYYMFLVALQAAGIRRVSPANSQAPAEPMNFA